MDFCDEESGRRVGVVVDSELVEEAICIGCDLPKRDPEGSMRRIIRHTTAIPDGEVEVEIQEGCYCDLQAQAGIEPYRVWNRAPRCQRCQGSGEISSRSVKGR